MQCPRADTRQVASTLVISTAH